MSVRQFEEERQERERKLKLDNDTLKMHVSNLEARIEHIEQTNANEINRLREALEFYADKANYDDEGRLDGAPFAYVHNVDLDEGEIARKALDGDSK